MLLIFTLKLYQFIRIGDKDEFIKELDSLYKEKSLFKEFIKYFKKNWMNSNFLNFDNLEKKYIKI